jgi:ABC-type sugar transport system substrate-binding protein
MLLGAGCSSNSTTDKSPDKQTSGGAVGAPSSGSSKAVKVGWVLHVLNDFTAVIKRGAENAGKDLGIDVEVVGPAKGESSEAIGMFEGMVQKGKDALVVVPMPGDVWVRPISEAIKAGTPVLTANMTSPKSGAEAWFGQDEYQSGVILAAELKKLLDAAGIKGGKIVVGNCAPSVRVLQLRYEGFKKGMEGTAFQVSQPHDVGVEITANYSAWENLAGSNPDAVAMVGLCSMDTPNLGKLRAKTNAKWLAAGYDLNIETLNAIKAGNVHLTLGQHPYLQGYLPVLAAYNAKTGKSPAVKGWVDVGTEVVTKANVDELYKRESDPAAEAAWYKADIAKRFSDMAKSVKPLPSEK